jgi:hypothetical protein
MSLGYANRESPHPIPVQTELMTREGWNALVIQADGSYHVKCRNCSDVVYMYNQYTISIQSDNSCYQNRTSELYNADIFAGACSVSTVNCVFQVDRLHFMSSSFYQIYSLLSIPPHLSESNGMNGDNHPGDNGTDAVQRDDDGKPTAKKIKREEDGEVETIPPVSSRGWHDIPDWGDREDSPLMKLPSELLDKIFCVRPELGVSLYLRQGSGICADDQVPRLCSFGWSLQILPTSHDR